MRVAADLRGQLDVFPRRQVLYKVIKLENKADVVAAVAGELLLVKRADLLAVQPDLALVGGIHPAQHMSTVVLPAPEGPRITQNSPFSIVKLTWSAAAMRVSPI